MKSKKKKKKEKMVIMLGRTIWSRKYCNGFKTCVQTSRFINHFAVIWFNDSVKHSASQYMYIEKSE